MLNSYLENSITNYKSVFTSLKDSYKWHADDKILMLVSTMYIINDKNFDIERYSHIADYIKANVGFFSYLKSTQRFTTAATLDLMTSDPKEGFGKLLNIYEKLIQEGFSRTTFTYIAAGTFLKLDDSKIDVYIKKSFDIFRGMKEKHFFLTGSGDYPLATLLSQTGEEVSCSIERMEKYYQELHKNGFYRGDSLQFLSHILALDPNLEKENLAHKCLDVKELLINNGIKVKTAYYPYVGILALLEQPGNYIQTIKLIYDQLNSDKKFKWQKDINFMVAIVFLLKEKTEFGDLVTTGMITSIESILQAQQAAMIASVSAATAASSSSSGG
ncbi:DUF4003 family protein [Metabacillus litoralis]|uniref:DUF4003 family protein n=1 Tax=Metabacillus litoralis TaxID=152268 RepID=UPI00203C6C2F|nr:DUF4003 family protein [Metabacillus litoralis]MCM3409243.1 DUF4003 domain-containing protein [Metabacillus litoralis]